MGESVLLLNKYTEEKNAMSQSCVKMLHLASNSDLKQLYVNYCRCAEVHT